MRRAVAFAIAFMWCCGVADAQIVLRQFNQLPAANPLSGTDVFPIQQVGANSSQTTLQAILTFMTTGITLAGDCTGSPAGVTCGPKLYRVANNAALALMAPTAGRVRRGGFAAEGDGGAADYVTTSVLCPLGGGAGDGGSQVGLIGPGGTPGTYVGCANLDPAVLRNAPSVKIWGANDTDAAGSGTVNATAWAAALAAVNSAGGAALAAPTPAVAYQFTGTVSDPYPNVQIVGPSGGFLVDLNFATGPGFLIGDTSGVSTIVGGGIKNVRFKHAVTRTSGADVQIGDEFNARAEGVTCGNQANTGPVSFQCVAVDASSVVTVRDVMAFGEGTAGIALGCNEGTLSPATNIVISGNNNLNYQHNAGLEICDVSGLTESGVNSDQNQKSVWIHPGIGQTASAMLFAQSFFDVSFGINVQIDDVGGGLIADNTFDPTVWIASSGESPTAPGNPAFNSSFTQNTTAAGAKIGSSGMTFTGAITAGATPFLTVTNVAAGATLAYGQIISGPGVPDETRIYQVASGNPATCSTGTPCTFYIQSQNTISNVSSEQMSMTGTVNNKFDAFVFNNVGAGYQFLNADNTTIGGRVTQNGCGAAGSLDGVDVAANVRHYAIDARIGGLTDLNTVNCQRYAVFNNGGTYADFFRVSGDFSGNVSGDYVDNTTGATHTMFDVLTNAGVKRGQSLHTPASSSETCVPGQQYDDANYHYVCTSANHLERAALSTF